MIKKGFTLIELIFTIVIIGVLATIAIPKYKDLKAHAELNKAFKVLSDALSNIPSAYINMVDLDGADENTIELKDIINIKGRGWVYDNPQGSYRGRYTYKLPSSLEPITIALYGNPSDRTILYRIQCRAYPANSREIELCKKKNNNKFDSSFVRHRKTNCVNPI